VPAAVVVCLAQNIVEDLEAAIPAWDGFSIHNIEGFSDGKSDGIAELALVWGG